MIFLGIDCGTQSTKTVALDWESGQIVASSKQAYGFIEGLPPGSFEQNPEDWIDAAEHTISDVLRQLGPRSEEVRSIGVSGQQHGLVVLDKNHKVVRPAKLWCDTSTSAEAAAITEHFGGDKGVIALVGNTMRPGYTAPKVLWMRKNEPQNWLKTTSVLLPHDYINFWLTGVFRMEFGDASGTALLDVETRRWATKVVNFVADDLFGKLPELSSSRETHGEMRADLCRKWGLSKAPTVSAGGGDNMMSAIGTGNIQPGAVTASLGTSGTLFAYSTSPVVDPEGEVAGFCDSTDNWLPLVCTMNLTLVSEHVGGIFHWNHEEMDTVLRSVPAGSGGLILLPYLTGERTPDLPQGTGVFHGLTLDNFKPEYMARAAVEGAILGLGYGLQRFRELGIAPAEIRLTGGGSNSSLWRQICADVFGVPTVCLKSGEGAGLGAAIQAGWTWNKENGSDASLPEACERLVQTEPATRSEPDSAVTKVYREVLERSTRLCQALHAEKLL